MANLKLSLACWDYDRTRPLIDGRVKPDGIDLQIEVLRPQQTFTRMLQNQEFQVSELSLASYATLKGRGKSPFVAIPVALSKIFRHSCIYVRADSGIKRPKDLRGRRVGITQYGSTGMVFIRGMLQHEYNVMPEDIHWYMGGLKTPTLPPLVPLELGSRVKIEFLRADQSLERMFDAAELDALCTLYILSSFLKGSPDIVRLFPNYKKIEQDYYRRTGIFPIMHTVVIREDVHREHPWVAESMYRAFCAARDLAVDGLYDTGALRVALPWLIDHVEETWSIMGEDFWAYGLQPNRMTWEAIGRYVHEQGLSPRPVAVDEMFPARVG